MKPSSLRGAALGLATLAFSCVSPSSSISTPEETEEVRSPDAPVDQQATEIATFVDCTNARIKQKIEARRRGEIVPPTTQAEVLDCTEPAFGLGQKN